MALSVSGFPEPSRHPGTSNEVFTGENAQDGYGKATLMNSPRLRGLFGASNGPGKRPDSKNSPTTSKSDTEVDSAHSAITASTPPSTPSLSFSSSSFEPLSQQEYELELQLPTITMPLDPPRAPGAKRTQLPPLPRKSTASPVRLGPNLARLDIGGAWARSPPTLHSHPKPLPPSVVVQEWGAKGADASLLTQQQPRPLPSVPGNTTDPGKHMTNAVASPSRLASAAVPVASPSRHVNAVAGSSKQVNAAAGSSKHPASLSSALPSPTPGPPPASKVLLTQPTPQRTHKQNPPSFSMRYQPLVAEPSATPSNDAAVTNVPDSATLSSPVRPLPRIPPPPVTSAANLHTASPAASSSRYAPPLANVKRPKTSPSPMAGFSAPGSGRSPFDNITSSWATRPVDLNAQRPHSPPLPISNGVKLPRARSHSRPRRDRSLDPYTAKLRTPLRVSSPPTGNSLPSARPPRSLPSPTIGGARPLPQKSATLDYIPPSNKALHIQTSNVALALRSGSSSSRILSPSGKRSQPPSPPTGPVKLRTKPSPISSPITQTPFSTSRSLPTTRTEPLLQRSPAPASAPAKQEDDETNTIETQSIDAPLHSHPLEAFADSESLLNPVSPSIAESPIEVFVDDKNLSTTSRSPSPIRYARPDSRGNLSESDDDDIPSSPSSSSSRTSSPNRRRRTQLLAYRNSYRPREGASPPHIPYRPRSPSPIPEHTPAEPGTEPKKKKEARKALSYFGGTGSGSAPATRASSPERKSRSRQPRRLAEAVTSALEDVRNRGRGASSSPKRKVKSTAGAAGGSALATPTSSVPVEEMEVLDISLPSLSRRETTATTETSGSISDTIPPTTSSARSSAKVGWAKTMAKKRSEPGDHSSSGSGTMPHLSSVVTAVELDGAETPYMWVSASKPPVTPAPFLPPPPPPQPHHHHRRMDSLGLEDYPLLNNSKQPAEAVEVDRHGVSCGLNIGGGGKSRSVETTITSTVSVNRPPSAPFSGFSLTGRSSKKSKKKRTASLNPPSSSTMDESSTVSIERDPPMVIREQDGNDIGWMDNERNDKPQGDVVVLTTKRIMRGIDHDGDVWEHEQETGVADVIPHLRNLKASKS